MNTINPKMTKIDSRKDETLVDDDTLLTRQANGSLVPVTSQGGPGKARKIAPYKKRGKRDESELSSRDNINVSVFEAKKN
jgi:hypothetical protein